MMPNKTHKDRNSTLNCKILISGSCVLFFCISARCMPQQNDRHSNASTTTHVESAPDRAQRPVKVADAIRMTRLADTSYENGLSSKGIVAKFSPDGLRFVVVLRRGNLEGNTNEYSLLLFETAEAFHSPSARVLVSL